MQTMHPCIMLGSYILDRDRLPEDEFRIRMEPVYRLMEERSLDALLVYGDAREHGALAYLSNFIPRMRWAMAMFPRNGDPRLLCSVSSRDIPAMRTMTWIGDVYSGWEWTWFDEWIAKLQVGNEPANLGTVEFGRMAPTLFRNVERSLGNRFRLIEQPDIVAAKDGLKRPRELSLLRSSCDLTGKAAAQFGEAWLASHNPERAALAGERAARMAAAQDVRTLVSFDNGVTLAPYRGTFDAQTKILAGYVAVKFAGYWSDAFVSAGAHPDENATVTRAIHALIETAHPGVTGAQLHRAASDILKEATAHPALEGSVGHRIGLSLQEGPQFTQASAEPLEANQTYSFHVGLLGSHGGCFASAIVQVRNDANSILLLSVPRAE
jgi:Xaa-Pro aminopeptidase